MNENGSQTIFLLLSLVIYVLLAYPLFVMAKKTDSAHPWFAFVPILNAVLMLEIADKDLWWLILLFVPCVNVIFYVIIWMGIAEAMDKPSWLGILMLVPGLNVLLPFYLAFA